MESDRDVGRDPTVLISPNKQEIWKSESSAIMDSFLKEEENSKCIDCGSKDPEWASVTLGVLICLECAGQHRALGVHRSFVRSVTMDKWSMNEIRVMQLGGNAKLVSFFQVHGIPITNSIKDKYSSIAAELYRRRLAALRNNLEPPESLPQSVIDAIEQEIAEERGGKKPTPSAAWTPDESRDTCEECNVQFTFLNRRHHCRRCGRLVCAECAPKQNSRPIVEWNLTEPVRHCKKCYRSPGVFKDSRVGKI